MRAPGLAPSALLLAIALSACGDDSGTLPGASASGPERLPAAPPPEAVYAPEVVLEAAPADKEEPYRIVSAFSRDTSHDTDEVVRARRLVYRVLLRVPTMLRDAPPTIPRPSAELVIDVSDDRLRARFEGTGWPIEKGAEVRIRRESSGSYVFDGRGGRPLGPGQLASWFQGGRARREPMVAVRPAPLDEQTGPGALVCRLVAEWTNQPIDALARRCGDGGAPLLLRVGPFRAERTADVGIELPRTQLRADEGDPPPRISDQDGGAFLSEELIRRIRPRYRGPLRKDEGTGTGLTIHNGGRSRIMVLAAGVPIGWVNVGRSYHFSLDPGVHRVAAIRPLGLPAMRTRNLHVPTELELGKPLRVGELDDGDDL